MSEWYDGTDGDFGEDQMAGNGVGGREYGVVKVRVSSHFLSSKLRQQSQPMSAMDRERIWIHRAR